MQGHERAFARTAQKKDCLAMAGHSLTWAQVFRSKALVRRFRISPSAPSSLCRTSSTTARETDRPVRAWRSAGALAARSLPTHSFVAGPALASRKFVYPSGDRIGLKVVDLRPPLADEQPGGGRHHRTIPTG